MGEDLKTPEEVYVLSFVWDEDLETPEDLVTQKELGTESKSETEAGTDPEVAEADLSEMLRIPYLFQRRYLYTWLPLDLVTIITLALATEAGTELEVANADLGEKLRIRYLIQRRYLYTWFPPDLVTIITLALLLGAEGMQHRVDPIRKVVTVLQMMQNKVEAEGVPRDREGGMAP